MIAKARTSLLGLTLLFCGCEELARDNPFDPKNPRSERSRVILVEAFVNEATPFSPFALAALDSLARSFSAEDVIIAEHHLPSTSFADQFALQESLERYGDLTAVDRGVPDVFFNGSSTRVQGASSVQTALARYRSTVDRALGLVSHFTIEAKKRTNGATISIEATIARLGDDSFSQFTVRAIVWEDLGAARRHRVVRKIISPETFSGINAGEKKTVELSAQLPPAVNPQRAAAAVFIEQNTGAGREILQVALAE
jgi:hypothetical protein